MYEALLTLSQPLHSYAILFWNSRKGPQQANNQARPAEGTMLTILRRDLIPFLEGPCNKLRRSPGYAGTKYEDVMT